MSATHTALIVDPDPEQRRPLRDRLAALGHRCEEAGSQLEAQERLLARRYCYLLLEPLLPLRQEQEPDEEVGWSLLEWVRSRHPWEDLGVIVVSTLEGDAPRVQALQGGANDWASKPARSGSDRLEPKVRRLAGRCETTHPACPSGSTPQVACPDRRRRVFMTSHAVHLSGRLKDGKHLVTVDGRSLLLQEGPFATLWRLGMANRDGAHDGWLAGERATAVQRVRMAISRLRRALSSVGAEGLIENDRHGRYRLTSPPRKITLDVRSLEAAGLGYLLEFSPVVTRPPPRR